MAIKIPKNLRTIRNKIEIIAPQITRISTSSLSPVPRSIHGAIKKNSDGTGFDFYPKLLPSDAEIISLSLTYELQNYSLIEDLVHTANTREASGPEQNEYWMHAQLKHPKILATNFGRFDLRDVAVTVDVAIHNELKVSIPGSFIKRLKIFFDLLNERNPREQFRVLPALRKLSKSDTAGRELDIFKDLEAMFIPTEFSRFLDVVNDFRYSTCYRGRESFDIPMERIPKKMEVISRADLTLEKPASEGTLIYKKSTFTDALKQIFS
jgi:hypothetical protein